MDVEFERHKHGIRPRLRFEAKRLGRGAGVSEYLGSEGLGAFLDCYYSRTHNEVGLLAYVQDGTEQEWAEKLAARLVSPHHSVLPDGSWEHLTIADAPPHAYRTLHTDNKDARLLVLHVLLQFSPR